MNYRVISTGVLVVGAGGAGIRAAIEAARNKETLLVTDGALLKTGSTFYEKSPAWGFMSANGEDDVDKFYDDILSAANGCINPKLAKILSRHSIEAYEDLIDYGLSFTKLAEMNLNPCFGKAPRGSMLDDLDQAKSKFAGKLKSMSNLTIAEGVSIVSLLFEENQCKGAVGFNKDNEMLIINANSVILSCGGPQNLYEFAYKNGTQNGSAYAMAGRHGARIVNTEFVQFINSTLDPIQGLNYYQFAFVTQPKITNKDGYEFLQDYVSGICSVEELLALRSTHGPFSIVDDAKYFDLAIVKESIKTGKQGAVVQIDPSKLQGERYRPWRKLLNEVGCPLDAPLTIFPHCHASNGGVLMHDDATTDLKGLFVCGEAAGGCHGSNRIGGNSMLGTQVFGKISGELAANYENGSSSSFNYEQAVDALNDECKYCGYNELTPKEVMSIIQSTMQRVAFLMRKEPDLNSGICTLEEANDRFNPNCYLDTGLAREAFEAFNALCAARLMLTAMRERRESRGGHFRTDFPQQNGTLSNMLAVTFCGKEITAQYIDNNNY